MAGNQGQDVLRRKVFYIPGYDPMVPRRYRELYRAEAAKQAKISGYSIDLKGKTGTKNYSWSVTATIDHTDVKTEFEFLLWSDIVQNSMQRSIFRTFLLLAQVVLIYVLSGALWRLMRLRRGPVIAALYPVCMLLGQLAVALAIAALAGWGLGWLLPVWLSFSVAALLVAGVMVLFRKFDNRLYAYYLLHDYAFSARFRGANPPELTARMEAFASQIGAALDSDVDEVLVVGHSSGAHIGVSVLADLLRRRPPGKNRPKLAFLTLGHVVPMVSFLPRAGRLRRDLHDLCQMDCLTWVDVTAPGDGCTFALCDPVAVSGVAPRKGQLWPLVISAAFSQTLSPALYKSLKRRFFRIHFQYLCAFDRPRDYDYFQITAGPLSLAARYRGRAPSPSTIRRSLSPHKSLGL